MMITYSGKEFIATCSYEERQLPRQAGFSFDSLRRVWYTYRPQVAARLREYLDRAAKREIDRLFLRVTPWAGRIPYPKHLTPLDFQVPAAEFALSRNRSYLGLDPGLGKTIVAAMIMNALPDKSFTYVCPPFLVANVKEELKKWCTRNLSGVRILRDTKISDAEGHGVLIVDEAHRFKNETAKRTKALFKLAAQFDRVIFMSGTPMPNRPIELYAVLTHASPELIGFMSKMQFGQRYCDAHHNGWGWDFTGAKNIPELKSRITIQWEDYEQRKHDTKFMLRVRKEVLQLPPKLEEIVLLSDELPAKIGALDAQLLEKFAGEDDMGSRLARELERSDLHVSTYRKELGKAKVKSALPFIESVLEETEENIILATWHREVVERLNEGLKKYAPLVIDGSSKPSERVGIAHEYQRNPGRRVIILNIVAGGVGLNLQKASRVVFVEFSWVPGDNAQLSDRAHRHGQKGSVLCQYLVFRSSIDRAVIESVLNKRRSTEVV